MSKAKFIGRAVTEWLDDGRTMKLIEPFSFVDELGNEYQAESGDLINGSSMPWFLWGKVFGSPFVGKHRKPSILHDIECKLKRKPYKQVHRMYFEGCIASGVNKYKAKLMYLGLKVGAPKW